RRRRQHGRRREELRRLVLHRAHPAPVVVVDRAPRPEIVLGSIDPAVLVRAPAGLRLPPDAAVADDRRLLEGQPRQPADAGRRHRASPIASITTLIAAGRVPTIRSRYSSTCRWTSCPSSGSRVPQSTSRCSSIVTLPSSPLTRTPRCLCSWLATRPRTPSISKAASAA